MSIPDVLSRNPRLPEVDTPYDESQELLAMVAAANEKINFETATRPSFILSLEARAAERFLLRNNRGLFARSQEKTNDA